MKSVVLTFLLIISGFLSPLLGQEEQVRIRFEALNELLGPNSFFDNHLTGFMLFDLDSQRVIYEKNSHINFIPASTTKLLTFYASVLTLKDSTRTLRYVEDGNQIRIWGTGDPAFKNDLLPEPGIVNFLKKYSQIRFSISNWKDSGFGYGWQWDDYYYSYSAERSPLPIYGNVVTFSNINKQPVPNISRFKEDITRFEKTNRGVERNFLSNQFYYNPTTYINRKSNVPFVTSPDLTVRLLQDIVQKPVMLTEDLLPADAKVYKGGSIVPLWKEMLQESDNFMAEQLLLMISDHLLGELNAERAIDYIKKTHLGDLPDRPQWVDGSGLSRHNLTTPRSMVALMVKLDQALPRFQLMQLLPQGGVSGTLKNNYKASRPYVFAKTGTISNNHSLVGYLRGDSGKLYVFAFMNNNYLNKASEIRREMEQVLSYIKENY